MALPDSLIEATSIDSAGTMSTFVHIALPNAKPVFATAAVLTIVKHWGRLHMAFDYDCQWLNLRFIIRLVSIYNLNISNMFNRVFYLHPIREAL